MVENFFICWELHFFSFLVVPDGEEGEEAAAEAPKEEEAKAEKPESEDLGAKQLEGDI